MARQIVNADGVPVPRDGTTFNAKFSGSVTKVRWSKALDDWECARTNGQWRKLDYDRSAAPETWWPEAKARA